MFTLIESLVVMINCLIVEIFWTIKCCDYTLCLKKTGTPLEVIVSQIQAHKIKRIFYQKNFKPILRKS